MRLHRQELEIPRNVKGPCRFYRPPGKELRPASATRAAQRLPRFPCEERFRGEGDWLFADSLPSYPSSRERGLKETSSVMAAPTPDPIQSSLPKDGDNAKMEIADDEEEEEEEVREKGLGLVSWEGKIGMLAVG